MELLKNMEKITTNKIANGVAKGEEIILRNNQITRLVFKPILLDNIHNIKGIFIFQKKGKNDNWEDINTESLSKLKKGEGYQLGLSSEELSTFLAGIEKNKKIYSEYGILNGKKTFYVTDENIEDILNSLGKFDFDKLKEAIKKIDTNKIESTINIVKYEKIIYEIENNLDNNKEKEYWQPLFDKENRILSQIFATPYVFLKKEAYLGGKSISNNGGIVTDFLFKNNISNAISIIEIKNPCSKLIGDKLYRGENVEEENAIYPLHNELTGAISQILNQKNSLLLNYNNLKLNNYNIKPYNIRSALIIGTLKNLNETQKRSFELHRQSYKDLEIITFDELLERIKNIYKLFNNGDLNNENTKEINEESYDDLPF